MPWSTAASSSGDGQLRVMGLRMVVRSLGLRANENGDQWLLVARPEATSSQRGPPNPALSSDPAIHLAVILDVKIADTLLHASAQGTLRPPSAPTRKIRPTCAGSTLQELQQSATPSEWKQARVILAGIEAALLELLAVRVPSLCSVTGHP
jgi:hypothetical protein